MWQARQIHLQQPSVSWLLINQAMLSTAHLHFNSFTKWTRLEETEVQQHLEQYGHAALFSL